MDIAQVLTVVGPAVRDLMGHEWVPAMVLLSTWGVALLSRDSRFPISLPASWDDNRWKPVAIVVAGQVQAGVLAVTHGIPAMQAVGIGFRTAMWSLGLWALVVKAIYKDKLPNWLLWLSVALPKLPPGVELQPAPGPMLVVGKQGADESQLVVGKKVRDAVADEKPKPVA